MNLSDFLLQRIAEDEEVARACTGPKWVSWTEGRDGWGGDSGLFIGGQADVYGWENSADRDHAARHDPARVLAECEAKRRIVALHPIDGSLRGPVTDNKFHVCACGPDSWPVEEQPGGKWGYVPEPESGDFYPCGTLKALAQPYADHPDFQEAWRA